MPRTGKAWSNIRVYLPLHNRNLRLEDSLVKLGHYSSGKKVKGCGVLYGVCIISTLAGVLIFYRYFS